MDLFFLDSNLFISLEKFSSQLWLSKFSAILDENKDIEFNVSKQILNELPFIRGEKRNLFKKIIKIHDVTKENLVDLKQKFKESNLAQDPDLTLLFLANESSSSHVSWLVTDDYKLVQNAHALNNNIKILTPGSFLLKLFTLTQNKYLKRFFKSMEKKVTDYSIQYILSRKDIYPAAKKLSWLIDRTASLILPSSDTLADSEDGSSEFIKNKTQFISSKELNEEMLFKIRAADLYLSGAMTLSKKHLDLIEPYLPFLDVLKTSVERLKVIKKEILSNDYENAREIARTLSNDVISACIKAKFEFPDEFEILYIISAIQVYKISFFMVYISLLDNDIMMAFNHLTETAYWAMQSHQDKALLNAVYMKAMLFFFNKDDIPDFYRKAIENFEYAQFLALNLENDEIFLKCLLGKAISSFQVLEIKDANEYIKMVQDFSTEKPAVAVDVFSEMADYFLAFGKPEYSVFLYDEALEAAVAADLDFKIQSLLEKMKRSYIIAGIHMNDIERGGLHLDTLLDESFELKEQEKVEKYNEQIMKLAQFNSLLYQPFPIQYKDWTTYNKVDKKIKSVFEIIDLEGLGELQTRITVYSSELGLIAISLPKKIQLAGPPESYSLKLSNKAKIKIRRVKGALFEKKLIRALVYVKDPDTVEFSRHIPAFLKII
ncbi:MAG: hypothetical protein ACTSVI_12955 [Promethearchaeota archaeon]